MPGQPRPQSGQDLVECPDCGGRGQEGDGSGWDGTSMHWSCETCDGTGAVPRADPRSGQEPPDVYDELFSDEWGTVNLASTRATRRRERWAWWCRWFGHYMVDPLRGYHLHGWVPGAVKTGHLVARCGCGKEWRS